MPLRTSISGTIISIVIGILITLGVSQNSIDFYGVPLLTICFLYSYIIHWIFFIHGYLFQTEHYFDAIGSFTFVSLSFFLIFTVQDFYAFLICSLVIYLIILRPGVLPPFFKPTAFNMKYVTGGFLRTNVKLLSL